MSRTRIAFVAIVLAVAVAEIVRPTQFAAKRVSHTSMLGIAAHAALDKTDIDDLPPIVTPAMGNIDGAFALDAGGIAPFASGSVLRDDATLRLAGWCADPRARAPGVLLLAIVDGTRRIDVTGGYRRPRPDVAAYFKNPAMRDTGFTVDLSRAELGPGPHTVRIAIVTADETAISEFPTVLSVGGT